MNQPSLDDSNSPPRTTFGQWMALIAALLGWMFDGFELGLLPLVARPALTDLLKESAQVDLWEGIWTAGFLVGMSTGGVVFGWLGDRIGRVRAMTLSVFAYSVFSGLCGFSRNAEEFFLMRFIAALGMGGEWSLGVALVMEIWPNRSRALLSGLIGAAANVGFLLVALFALGLANFIKTAEGWLIATHLPSDWVSFLIANQGWRLLMILGAAPAILTFFIRLAVPESEKWLHAKEQGSTSNWATRDLLGVVFGCAGALLIVYLWLPSISVSTELRLIGSALGLVAALTGYIYPVYQFLRRNAESGTGNLLRPTISRLLVGATLSGVALIGTWASIQRAPSWANDLAREAAEKQNLPKEQVDAVRISARAQCQISSGIGAIVGTIAGAMLGSVIGRRPTYTLLCLGSLLSSVLFFRNIEFGPLFLITVFVAGGLTASFYGWLPLYLPELFRTNVRATAQGFAFNFGRILAAVAALQTGNLIGLFKSSGGLPTACSVMSLVYVIGMVIIWIAPETKGQPLPE